MLQQVVVNIVKNGIESIESAGKPAGRVKISTRSDKGQALLGISDSGAGIAPGCGDKIFTPFFTTKPSGQGLGLTFVAEALENHGCRFSLSPLPASEAPYTTRFLCSFPRIQ